MSKTKVNRNVVAAKVRPVVTLDACSEKYSQKITAKKISKTVKSNMKLLRNVSFG